MCRRSILLMGKGSSRWQQVRGRMWLCREMAPASLPGWRWDAWSEGTMKKTLCSAVLGIVMIHTGLSSGSEIEFVTVGDPGNAPYTELGLGIDTNGNYITVTNIRIRSVNHEFRLGKYEITQQQYLEFLNAVDPKGSNALGLFHASTPPIYGDQSFDGCDFILDVNKSEGQRYALRFGDGTNVPVWGMTWYSAARFCNWLHNGKGGPGSTEGDATNGAYDTRLFDDGIVTNDPSAHNSGARFWIPTFDEWCKAAYYKGGGTNSSYWTGPFRVNGEPNGGMPSDDPNTGNVYPRYGNPRPPAPGKRVPVGSYPNALSPYGCLDMGGNGNEWSELMEINYAGAATRRVMGGFFGWFTDHLTLNAQLTFSTHMHPPTDWWNGLRVAALTESADVDSHGIPSAWKIRYFGSSTATNADAMFDADGDGMNNLSEYVAGTDPADAGSRFQCSVFGVQDGAFGLGFRTVTGRMYTVLHADELPATNWGVITGNVSGTGGELRINDPAMQARRFYRVGVKME
ncbi:MAG: hypothetical protein C0404_11795 [Verrucomicrobia bacterium]|nr:hypothetical protein [Verrucomicrobiota bacterium]